MINTILLEKYTLPTPLSIDVTILRGPRKIRLGTFLHRKYADFLPRLWEILALLGYKKYLQRIYVSIDAPRAVQSSLYQLPITIAVLQKLRILTTQNSITCLGKITPSNIIIQDEFSTRISQANQWISSPQATPLLTYMNMLTKGVTDHGSPFVIPQECLNKLFRGIIWNKKRIDTEKTPASILRRVSEETLETLTL